MTEDARETSAVEIDVVKVIRDAWAAVDAAEIPEPLHVAAFEQAVALIVGPRKAVISASDPPIQMPQNAEATTRGDGDGGLNDEDTFFATLSSESKVDEEKLRKVYFMKDGSPRIGLSKSKLGSSEAERNRAVATLLAGLRWYVEGKQSVMIGEIRDAAGTIPYEVSRNLTTQIDSVAGTITVGAKNSKAVRVQGSKFDEPFRALIEKLTAN